jgi:hypothetical protein
MLFDDNNHWKRLAVCKHAAIGSKAPYRELDLTAWTVEDFFKLKLPLVVREDLSWMSFHCLCHG